MPKKIIKKKNEKSREKNEKSHEKNRKVVLTTHILPPAILPESIIKKIRKIKRK